MKKKLLPVILILTTALCCAFAFSACNTDTSEEEPTAFELAYEEYYKTENFKAVVTDSRIQKYYDKDYSATVEMDYANKSAHVQKVEREYYYEIVGEGTNKSLSIYGKYQDNAWNKISRPDLFDEERLEIFDSERQYEIHLLTNWVESFLPTHSFDDTCYSDSGDNEDNWASLRFLANKFT